MRLRASITGGGAPPVKYHFGISFPSVGSFSISSPNTITNNLGIWWANPADHTQQLPSTQFNFVAGCSFFGTNDPYWTSENRSYPSDGTVTATVNFYMVDQSGADMGSALVLGTVGGMQKGAALGGMTLRILANAYTAVPSGIRGELVLVASATTGSIGITVQVPATWYFIGASN